MVPRGRNISLNRAQELYITFLPQVKQAFGLDYYAEYLVSFLHINTYAIGNSMTALKKLTLYVMYMRIIKWEK